jgi:hypothetical protein
MSGGAFEYNQRKITDIADDIQKELDNQGKEKSKEELWMAKDYYDDFPEEKNNYTYPEEVQEKFRDAIKALRTAAIYAQRIDWLLSGDDGEESFLRRLDEELTK